MHTNMHDFVSGKMPDEFYTLKLSDLSAVAEAAGCKVEEIQDDDREGLFIVLLSKGDRVCMIPYWDNTLRDVEFPWHWSFTKEGIVYTPWIEFTQVFEEDEMGKHLKVEKTLFYEVLSQSQFYSFFVPFRKPVTAINVVTDNDFYYEEYCFTEDEESYFNELESEGYQYDGIDDEGAHIFRAPL